MTNEEKYKTSAERLAAYRRYEEETQKAGAEPIDGFSWLEQEVPLEKILPCPFCGGEVKLWNSDNTRIKYITCPNCEYESPSYKTCEEAITAHNKVSNAVLGEQNKIASLKNLDIDRHERD